MALLHDVVVTDVATVTAGTSTITGSTINMSGFDGVLIVTRLGTPATNNNLRVQQCDTSTGTYADLTGTLVGNSSTDNPLIVDVFRPRKQFVKYQIARPTSTTIEHVTIVQYNARNRPTTQPSPTQSEAWNWPAEGTA